MTYPTKLQVNQSSVTVINHNGEDFICLTDMVRNIGGSAVVENWFRNKNTIEFLGVWEKINNPKFNSPEFEGIRNAAGTHRFVLSVKQWLQATNAIGVRAQAGRYGGTYAHRDIAFEFGAWVSPEFKFVLIKEFQRLKDKEAELEHWDYRRFLTRANYHLQTNAIQQTLIPLSDLPVGKHGIIYANEADLVNLCVFGITAQEWRKQNPKSAKTGNIRDYATIEQLTVLANLESMNSMLISTGLEKEERFKTLQAEAIRELRALATQQVKVTPPKDQKRLG